MKALTCEMCGSNNLIKQDGEYVCQHCGTKYTTEEAKKLMIEVSGKVEAQNDKKLARLDESGARFIYFASIQDLKDPYEASPFNIAYPTWTDDEGKRHESGSPLYIYFRNRL